MKKIIINIYLYIYSNVKGETEIDKIETTNLQLTLYFILSPISVLLVLFLIKLGIKNKMVVAILLLLYFYIINLSINRILHIDKIMNILSVSDISYYEGKSNLYYLITYGLLVFFIAISLMSLFLLTPLIV